MTFGQRIRELRQACGMTQQQLAVLLNVSLSYVSKVENDRLNTGDYPSEDFVLRASEALMADPDELLLLTDRVPLLMRRRISEQPTEFQKIAKLSKRQLSKLVESLSL